MSNTCMLIGLTSTSTPFCALLYGAGGVRRLGGVKRGGQRIGKRTLFLHTSVDRWGPLAGRSGPCEARKASRVHDPGLSTAFRRADRARRGAVGPFTPRLQRRVHRLPRRLHPRHPRNISGLVRSVSRRLASFSLNPECGFTRSKGVLGKFA
jgi:hypothetical protein